MQLLSTAVHKQVQGEGILTEPVVKTAHKYDILKYPNKELFNSGCLQITKYKPIHTIHHDGVYLCVLTTVYTMKNLPEQPCPSEMGGRRNYMANKCSYMDRYRTFLLLCFILI